MDERFTDLILRFTGEASIGLSHEQARLLSRHVRIMLEWNPRLNLTRIAEPEEIVIKHVLDSIVPAKFIPSSGHALDIGTGAGFPGIPLKIVNPDLQMVLLDSSRKKVSFLTAAAAALGLKGIQALHGRWQEFSEAEGHMSRFDLITMRAVRLEAEHITRLASSVLAPGGVFAWWGATGSEQVTEPGDSGTAGANYCPDMEFQGDLHYMLPRIKQRRAIRMWRKIRRTN